MILLRFLSSWFSFSFELVCHIFLSAVVCPAILSIQVLLPFHWFSSSNRWVCLKIAEIASTYHHLPACHTVPHAPCAKRLHAWLSRRSALSEAWRASKHLVFLWLQWEKHGKISGRFSYGKINQQRICGHRKSVVISWVIPEPWSLGRVNIRKSDWQM